MHPVLHQPASDWGWLQGVGPFPTPTEQATDRFWEVRSTALTESSKLKVTQFQHLLDGQMMLLVAPQSSDVYILAAASLYRVSLFITLA